jgi:VanZ family protein
MRRLGSRWAALRWLAVAGWAGVIFAFSAQPDLRVSPMADLETVVRKAGHLAAFGLLAVLLLRALEVSARRAGEWNWAWAWAWALAALYAISDEVHQGFTRGRHPSGADVAIDAAGAALFLVGLAVWRRLRSGARR